MHKILLYLRNITIVDWYNGLIKTIKKNYPGERIIMCLKLRMRTSNTLYSMLYFLGRYPTKHHFCHDVIKAQWQRSLTE